MLIAEHWVATTRMGGRLLEPRQAAWLWERMRENFPDAFSLTLMPDHLHFVAPPGAGPRFRRLLSAFTARFGVRFDILPEERANSRDIATRMMRYGFFNPVRDGIVDDPWTWPWSTLRDLGGAAHPIWTPLDATAAALATSTTKLLRVLSNLGDHRSLPPQPVAVLTATLDGLCVAVGSALRIPSADVVARPLGRQLVVQASDVIGLPGASRLAETLGCSRSTLYHDRAPRHPALDAVLLCLGDPRLRGPSGAGCSESKDRSGALRF